MFTNVSHAPKVGLYYTNMQPVIQHEANEEATLTGPVHDQTELWGLLLKVANLNLTLIAVNQVETGN